jgi:hypothetical protein
LTHYRAKTATFEKEIAEWHDVITGTDHDDVAKTFHYVATARLRTEVVLGESKTRT